ncbi:hypothetical protein ABT160_37445 [Streptomyces sp. NPDC001941]|uniref:hypothetical protein n=1 Tax=Streptomyces sp. NPDC001941 TaxID=3154659 RepID=UPI00331E8A44
MEMRTWRDAWARADSACRALQGALVEIGLSEDDVRGVRAHVHRQGVPLVHLGVLRADHVEAVAEALRMVHEGGVNDAAATEGATHDPRR